MVKLEMRGDPEDIIQRCKECAYCIFEDLLTPEQRKIRVLDNKIPEPHPHRMIIEQICGMDRDKVCPMKYAAMRAEVTDDIFAQWGVIKNLCWDLGKKYNRIVKYPEASILWGKLGLDGDSKENYSKKFRDVWKLGLRQTKINGNKVTKEKQTLTVDGIYEIIVANKELYQSCLENLKQKLDEHFYRDKNGL